MFSMKVHGAVGGWAVVESGGRPGMAFVLVISFHPETSLVVQVAGSNKLGILHEAAGLRSHMDAALTDPAVSSALHENV